MPRAPFPPWLGPHGFDRRPRQYSVSPPPCETYSDVSYDEWGQARGAGGGQGLPLDENGRYIRSPPPPSPSVVGPVVEKSPRHLDTASECVVDPPCLKRSRCDNESNDSLPQTPCRRGQGSSKLSLTNPSTPSRARLSLPLTRSPRAPKRRRLRAPINFGMSPYHSRMDNLEGAMKVLQRDVKAALAEQTQILTQILDTLREGDRKN
ncbi:hypothetical protein JVT61DRAFT_8550 [Boletus reticuloceps]|uniref:Uncharacterized protein n=1 Tax=Boletus reticuloceps TaxID=495285 RepID=A0A8I3AFG4_9AGAM|nr:hypothetical protein JVT61DRAFT_8550 [Boletus reticuloceps]